jgi:hypothetical protein
VGAHADGDEQHVAHDRLGLAVHLEAHRERAVRLLLVAHGLGVRVDLAAVLDDAALDELRAVGSTPFRMLGSASTTVSCEPKDW